MKFSGINARTNNWNKIFATFSNRIFTLRVLSNNLTLIQLQVKLTWATAFSSSSKPINFSQLNIPIN